MKSLGGTYVRSEFRLHKGASPQHAQPFLQEWSRYLEQVQVQTSALEMGTEFGADLPPDAELSDEQRLQLAKLRDETDKMK
jgi:hypothetical protein